MGREERGRGRRWESVSHSHIAFFSVDSSGENLKEKIEYLDGIRTHAIVVAS